jgi:hypothetical protein
MQTEIRGANKEDFSRLEDFIAYKTKNELATTTAVSKKYITILDDLNKIQHVLSSIKDY